MPVDPFSFPDPFNVDFAAPRRRRQAAFPAPPDPVVDTAIDQLTSLGSSGLGYIGSSIDKYTGSRAARAGVDILTGGRTSPWELLSMIPGTDVVGLTSEAGVPTGEKLIEPAYRSAFGHAPSQGNWLERNLVGPGVEVALDPTLYLGGIGALTRAGKAAAKAGTATKGFLPAVAAGERTLAYGLRGQRVADAAQAAVDVGKGINTLARKIPGVAPIQDVVGAAGGRLNVIRRSAFDKLAGAIANPEVQFSHEFTKMPAKEALLRLARGQTMDLYDPLRPVLEQGADPEQVYRYLTQYGERQPIRNTVIDPAHQPVLDAVGNQLRALYDAMPDAEQALGLTSARLGSKFDVNYMLRRAIKGAAQGKSRMEKLFRTSHPSQIRRQDIFDVPGGTIQLEDWIRDPTMSGVGRAAARKIDPQDILDTRLAGLGVGPAGTPLAPKLLDRLARQAQAKAARGFTPKEARGLVTQDILDTNLAALGVSQTGIPLAPELLNLEKQARGLSSYLGKVKPQYIDVAGRAEPTVPFFARDVPANFLARAGRGAEARSSAEAIYDVIGRLKSQGGGGLPVARVLAKAGLKGTGALESAVKAVGLKPDDIYAAAVQAAGGELVNRDASLRKALKGFSVPEREGLAATKLINRFNAPEEVGAILPWLDTAINQFKAGTYAIWPASHGRNLLSGLYENLMEGTADPRAYAEAKRLLAAGSNTPENAAKIRELYVQGLLGQPHGEFSQAVGVRIPEVGTGDPGLPRKGIRRSWLDPLKEVAGDPRMLWRERAGVAGTTPWSDLLGQTEKGVRQVDTNPLVRAGRDVSSAIEDRLRTAEYLDLRKKGFTPEAAAAKVRYTHIDYSNLTDFEKQFMKRLVPYYSFSRHNIPKQFMRAVQSPAKVGLPLRFAGGGEGGYVPEYLQSGLALPVGAEEEGTQRYLSQLGLPFEEAFSRLKVGAGPVETASKTAEGLLGTINPLLRAPFELATGKQFFTGRELKDLHPGKIESFFAPDEDTASALAQFVSATPLSRMLTTANRLLDERKWRGGVVPGLLTHGLGLTTGAKLTDVETEKWRGLDARHALENLLSREDTIRESVDYYPTPEAKAAGEITPQQAYLLSIYNAMKARAREAAKEKRRIGVMTPSG